MAAILTGEDIARLTPEATPEERQQIVDDALALAGHYAPILRAENVPQHVADVARAVILAAIKYDLRVEEAGVQTQHEQLGPYAVTNFAARSNGTLFSPSQIEVLKSLGRGALPTSYSVTLDVPDTLPRR